MNIKNIIVEEIKKTYNPLKDDSKTGGMIRDYIKKRDPEGYKKREKDIIKKPLKEFDDDYYYDTQRPQKGDYVRIYVEERGKKYPYYITYIDSTHVDVTNREPKPGDRPSGFVAHVGQLKHTDYYDDMIKWMRTGDSSHIEDKAYIQYPPK